MAEFQHLFRISEGLREKITKKMGKMAKRQFKIIDLIRQFQEKRPFHSDLEIHVAMKLISVIFAINK